MLTLADPKDPELRKLENSFLLGPILIYARFNPFFFTDAVVGDCRTLHRWFRFFAFYNIPIANIPLSLSVNFIGVISFWFIILTYEVD